MFETPVCTVRVLRPERTFWEKVTLLHAVTLSGKKPPRLSRHYYDVSRLFRHEVGRAAITDLGLLDAVVKHKSAFFREASARYDLARPDSLRISTGPELERGLRRDYPGDALFCASVPRKLEWFLEWFCHLEWYFASLTVQFSDTW